MKGLTTGRMVHYMPATDDRELVNSYHHHAAIVVQVLNQDNGLALLTVLSPSGSSMSFPREAGYSSERSPRSWHWIEKV